MSVQTSTPNGPALEVLIFAPIGQDSHLIATVLARESIQASVYRDGAAVCARLAADAGALVIAEEALSIETIKQLNERLSEQAPWSDLPIIVMTSKGESEDISLRILKVFTPSGNVTLLERPVRQVTLASTLSVALRARMRQYQVRELLEKQVEATRLRDEFISIASHELKTPLTSLKLQTQLTRRLHERDPENFSPERTVKLINVTDKQVDRLTHLVEDMLDVSRINLGKLLIHKTDFDMGVLIAELVERFTPQLSMAACAIQFSCEEGIWGKWDRYRIEQVVSNLLTNVIRYAPGKPVKIQVLRKGARAHIIVEDEGTGILPENRERIFQRFERAVFSDNISGLGLGLYICRQIVESHRGSIRVEGEFGRGSKFIVDLPLTVTDETPIEIPLATVDAT